MCSPVPKLLSDSPEPPVPPLPRSAAPSRISHVDQEDGPAIGIADTIDQPVHLSSRVTRSRASSVNALNAPALNNLASSTPLIEGGVRTSWANHHPPIMSQRNSEWTPSPVDEHPEDEGAEHEHMSANGEDDLSATDLDSVGGDEDQDHTYNAGNSLGPHPSHHHQPYHRHQRRPFELPEQRYPSAYNDRSSTAMGNAAPMRPDMKYSVASGGPAANDEWDGQRRERVRENTARQAVSRALTETDVSEVDESEYGDQENDELVGRRSKETDASGFGMEERTAAVILAEEGGGLIVNVSGGSLLGLEIKQGETVFPDVIVIASRLTFEFL